MVIEAVPGSFLVKPEIQLLLTPVVHVQRVWTALEEFVEQIEEQRSADPQLLGKDDYLKSLMEGRMQLWAANSGDEWLGAMVTELAKFPKAKVCRILWVCGRQMDLWFGYLDFLEKWAAGEGCSLVIFDGRKGWIRKLRDNGYRVAAYKLVKEISKVTEH